MAFIAQNFFFVSKKILCSNIKYILDYLDGVNLRFITSIQWGMNNSSQEFSGLMS